MESKTYKLSIAPRDILQQLQGERGVFLLESSLRHRQRGRYSLLGFDPFLTVQGDTVSDFLKFKKAFDRFVPVAARPLTPLAAGAVGYFSYDFGLEFEKINSRHAKSKGIPGFLFNFYDTIITIDHWMRKVVVTSSGYPEQTTTQRKKRALDRLSQVHQLLAKRIDLVASPVPYAVHFKSNFTKSNYCRAVKKALDYIAQGDIYQVNLSQAFCTQHSAPVDAVALYQILQKFSPSSFGGYFDAGLFQIVSSSPELFLSLRQDQVETRPMKGTRPRGQTPMYDRKRYQDLLHSHKEKAELLMVTDLERNDLGRVCEFGSVKVQKVREIEKYNTVFQATATVRGTLAQDKDGFEVLRACFPGGSITGCPKIRAMQIIDELESSRRGIYTGAMGYFSLSGDMAFNILIRTMLVQKKMVSFHVGGGIVADSQPEAEYEETLLKAKAIRQSLGVDFDEK